GTRARTRYRGPGPSEQGAPGLDPPGDRGEGAELLDLPSARPPNAAELVDAAEAPRRVARVDDPSGERRPDSRQVCQLDRRRAIEIDRRGGRVGRRAPRAGRAPWRLGTSRASRLGF